MGQIQHRVVLVTGGFDPCHRGHISYLRAARELGDLLILGLNSNEWLIRNKDLYLMDWEDRAAVLGSIRYVDQVIGFDDRDGTASDAIKIVKSLYPDSEIIFANGNDRTSDNIPETEQQGVTFLFGVGGNHRESSSSDILRRYAYVVLCRHEQQSAQFRGYE
jgi:cytidyltransferase-like protein